MSAGTHSVVVRAWDSTGAYGDQTLNLTVPEWGCFDSGCGNLQYELEPRTNVSST